MTSIRVRLHCTDALGATQLLDVSAGGVCGRDPSADIVLEHPTVSRRHARLTVRGSDVELEDLGSANGTFVNSRQLDQRPCLLADGDHIRLGHLHLRVYLSPADASTERAPPPATEVRGSAQETMHGGPRIEPQLLLARIAQRRMLSDRPPEIDGYEIGHVIVPALGVGGDFLYWGIANDGRRALVMGDVCGKGVAAAMYMAFVSGALFEVVPACGNPESILRRLNRSLHAVVEPGLFVTAMAVMLDTRTHQIEIACAGHPPGLLKRADGSVVALEIDSGIALGPDDNPDFGVLRHTLAPREVLMVTTDGVDEARNLAGEELGTARVIQVLAEAAGATDAARRLQWTINQHAGQARQHDDLTVVTLERCR